MKREKTRLPKSVLRYIKTEEMLKHIFIVLTFIYLKEEKIIENQLTKV